MGPSIHSAFSSRIACEVLVGSEGLRHSRPLGGAGCNHPHSQAELDIAIGAARGLHYHVCATGGHT